MVMLDEEFEDPTQFIVSKEKVVGTTKMNHIRLKKILSGKRVRRTVHGRYNVRKMEEAKQLPKGPLILEAVLPIANSSDEPFVLDIPSFELEMPKPVIIELPEQFSVTDMTQVP
ncbi:hypothetical protein ACH5RR_029669 [Cinchona calisaya]|uniref:Uncharacterized protein n=1 Tax=Cinchona calisaya TaxID=153742 RepID=A0ABD2YSF3_9GENT